MRLFTIALLASAGFDAAHAHSRATIDTERGPVELLIPNDYSAEKATPLEPAFGHTRTGTRE